MNPSTDVERRWLDVLGDSIRNRLAVEPDRRLRLTYEEVTDLDDTGGISSRIGSIPAHGRTIEIFAVVDGFSGRRVPWIGMLIPGRPLTMQIQKHFRSHGYRPRVIPDAQMIETEGIWRMKTALRTDQIRKPLVELYAGQDRKGIGAYFPAPRTYGSEPSTAVVDEATEFVKELTVAVGAVSPQTLRLGAQRKILKRAVVSVRVVRRDSKQAREVKQRDDYTCRICDFRPEAMYGAFGRGCLEAHHLDEVGGRYRATSVIHRMITVCANCHRVLHRLPPADRRLATLRRWFGEVRRQKRTAK